MAKQFPAACLTGLLCLLTCVTAVLSGCGGSTPSQTQSEEPAPMFSAAVNVSEGSTTLSVNGVYTDPDRDYQLTIPDGWKEDSSQTEKNRILFVSPEGTRSVELKKQTADCNLLAYSQSDFTRTYQESLDNFRLQSFKTVTANGSKGIALRYTCTRDNTDYVVLQYVMAGDFDYNITYSAIDGDDAFLTLAEASIGTFRELDPEHDPATLANRLNGRVYTDGTNFYTITLPKNWRISERNTNCVIFTSSDRKSNINVRCSAIDAQLFRYEKSYFTTHFQGLLGKSATITEFTTTTVNGKKALYLACRYSYNGQTLLSKQYNINSGDTTYIITFTSTVADADKTKFDDVAKTFQLQTS